MQLARNLIVVVAVTGVILPLTARDCLSGFGFNIGVWGPCGGCGLGLNFCLCAPCFGCHQQPGYCGCAAPPMFAPQPTCAPSLSYRQEQFVTYRDVPQTQIRREAYVEVVPVTTMVPQTVYQQQTRYRDVAYQTTQRVAETHTRLVPQQTISFAQPSCAAPVAPSYGMLPSSQAYTSYPTATPTGVTPVYSSPAIPTMPSMTVSPYGTNPVPQYPDVPSASREFAPGMSSGTGTTSSRPSMFRPAPSAARVQQSPRF